MKKYFLIGIGGSGLSAIARLLMEAGHQVAGSDRFASPMTQSLAEQGAHICIDHQAEQVHGADVVIQSSAIPEDNPEVLEARRLGIPVQKRSAFLEDFLKDRQVIAIAGTAGKTTTTAMLAWLLTCLNLDPGYLIGGVSANTGTNSHYGTSKYFVIEADEYDRMFHGLHPEIMVITNVEHDHPDMFPEPADYDAAFNEFIQRLQPNGRLLVGEHAAKRLNAFQQYAGRKYTFGLAEDNDFQLRGMTLQPDGCFRLNIVKQLRSQSISCLNGNLNVPGEHNALNALAAMAVVELMGYSTQQAIKCLEEFKGVQRRFEKIGSVNGVLFIDDYAHHPAKIRSTLQAARAVFPDRRIYAVWQPHTYSRTETFFDDFAGSFTHADQVIITEVYSAREQSDGFTAARFIDHLPEGKAVFCSDFLQAEDHLLSHLQPGDVLIVLSAGDANQIIPHVMERMQSQNSSAGVTSQVMP